MAQYAFGWLDTPLAMEDHEFQIRPVQNFEEAVAAVREVPSFANRWVYPPIVRDLVEGVDLPCGRYELPPTHILVTHNLGFDRYFGEFVVLVLGFLLGLRLTIAGTGHLLATPWKRGTLVNFMTRDRDVIGCLHRVLAFWNGATPEDRKLAFAAVHLYLMSQSYRQQYEEFAWQYAVMDNIHLLSWNRSAPYRASCPYQYGHHSQRPLCLHQEYRAPLPSSFAEQGQAQGNVVRLVRMRNELLHEARWAGEPIGYAANADAHDMIEDLKHFNSQLILGFLTIECGFRQLEYSRQIAMLDLIL